MERRRIGPKCVVERDDVAANRQGTRGHVHELQRFRSQGRQQRAVERYDVARAGADDVIAGRQSAGAILTAIVATALADRLQSPDGR